MPKVSYRQQHSRQCNNGASPTTETSNNNMNESRHVSFEESECEGANLTSSNAASTLLESLFSNAQQHQQLKQQLSQQEEENQRRGYCGKISSKQRTTSLLKRPAPSVCLSAMAIADQSSDAPPHCLPTNIIERRNSNDDEDSSSDFSSPALSSLSDETIDSTVSKLSSSSTSFSWWGHFVDIIPPPAQTLASNDYSLVGNSYLTPTSTSTPIATGRWHHQQDLSPSYQPYTIRKFEDRHNTRTTKASSRRHQYQANANNNNETTKENNSTCLSGFILTVPPSRISETNMDDDNTTTTTNNNDISISTKPKLQMKKHPFTEEISARNDMLLMDGLKRLKLKEKHSHEDISALHITEHS